MMTFKLEIRLILIDQYYDFLIQQLINSQTSPKIMFFELQDISRRHSPYFYQYNVGGWTTTVDSTPSWNLQRGIMIGAVAATAQQYISHLINNAKLLLNHYQNPKNLRQGWTFFNATRKLPSFRSGLKSRMQYAATAAVFDIGLKVAFFRQFNSGWQNNFGGFEFYFYRKIPTVLGAMIFSSPFAVAIQMAQRAYYADSTFPEDLRKGYKSFFDAFRRIPVEEGPYYLFKNTFPLWVKHILGPFTLFYTYDWLKDKMSWMQRVGNMPLLPTNVFIASVATYLAAVFSYPFAVVSRQMVDLWPKKNGIDPFNGNYRKAATWLWFGPSWNLAFPGLFSKYFWHIAPMWFMTLLLADEFGMFNYWRVDMFSGAGDNSNDDSYI